MRQVGAGNSSLAAALAAEGQKNGDTGSLAVVATDLSPVAVAAMQARTAGTPGLTYQACIPHPPIS